MSREAGNTNNSGGQVHPMVMHTPPTTWADFVWPEWIPEKVREQLRTFWCEAWGRGPHSWFEFMSGPYNHHPPLGALVEVETISVSGKPILLGRWIPMWNNMGRVLMDDGTIQAGSTCNIKILEA